MEGKGMGATWSTP
jgi:Fic/DOC family